MKVKELIEELQKCNPDAKVESTTPRGGEFDVVEVDVGNPASCASAVLIIIIAQ